jgi:hypothetical protein
VALSTIANCGSCGNACATGTPACCETNGALACTDTSSDPLNCGGCGAAGVQCGTAADGGPPSCVGGACQ